MMRSAAAIAARISGVNAGQYPPLCRRGRARGRPAHDDPVRAFFQSSKSNGGFGPPMRLLSQHPGSDYFLLAAFGCPPLLALCFCDCDKSSWLLPDDLAFGASGRHCPPVPALVVRYPDFMGSLLLHAASVMRPS